MCSALMSMVEQTFASRLSSRRICRSSVVLALVLLLVLLLNIPMVEASVPCQTNEDCSGLLNQAVGAPINPQAPPSLSECGADGFCTNPYQNGCLINRLPGWTKLRICNSEDPDNAAELGLCTAQSQVGWEHMEIRIEARNWESVFFEAWILQILLSEILNVPTTLETGLAGMSVNLYDPATRMDYGSNTIFASLETSNEVGDCRLASKTAEGDDKYQACAHLVPEVWHGDEVALRDFEERGIIEPHTYIGLVGFENWFLPKFTGVRDPTIMTYLGLGGEGNRRKLAERFKRPTTWQDYCDLVSVDRCLTDDGVAKRAPLDASEYDHMFVDGVYTGHFRMTEENDCDKWPQNCTGHIADFPCGWSSYVVPLTYHLEIALSSSGKEAGSRGYSYAQLVQIWMAANATKSDVIMQWWTPEALVSLFMGTDAEFQPVALPPSNFECMENRINPVLPRCGDYTFEDKVGSPLGACGDSPNPLMKLVSSALYSKTYDPEIPEARVSPAYEAIGNFRIDVYQLGKIFDYWLNAGFDKWNFDPRDATCRWVVENFEELQRFVPRTYPRVLQENNDSYKSPLAYVSFILGGVTTAFVVICAVLTFKQKSRRVMVYAQVEFMFLLLVGVLLVSIGSMIQAMRPTNFQCVTLIWLINLGYTLELVPLIVKIGAINRLMQAARRMRRVVLPRKQLFGAVALLVAIVCVFLILWTVLDKPQRQAFYTLTENKAEYGETIVLLDYFCQSERFRGGWQFISLGVQCFFLLVASVLAFQTRNLSKGINEAQTLATLIYSHFVFVGCRFMIFVFEASLGAVVVSQVFSMLYSLDSIATLVIYFLPKLMAGESDDFVQNYYGNPAGSMVGGPNGLRTTVAGSISSLHRFSLDRASTAQADAGRHSIASNPEHPEHSIPNTVSTDAAVTESGEEEIKVRHSEPETHVGHSLASSPPLPDNDLISPCKENQDVSTDGAVTESGDEEMKSRLSESKTRRVSFSDCQDGYAKSNV